MDLEDIEYVRSKLKFRGAQGTTGTQVRTRISGTAYGPRHC
jgi:hypothetical protein